MNYQIKNSFLNITVSTHGAELQSVKNADGKEYLWQGDVNTWKDKAINIFPYVARLTEGKYQYDGKIYEMNHHGLAPYEEFLLFTEKEDEIVFYLNSNEKTKKQYPFSFTYLVHYKLKESALEVTFEVQNKDDKTMYFGLGGHPGFIVPLEEGLTFHDYMLEFGGQANPYQIGMSKTCFVTGQDKPYKLRDGKYMDLSHEMFDNDAIILRDMCREVTLKSEKGTNGVKVTYPEMSYLGIWHWPNTEVDYVCIEPWSSLPSRQDIIEDIAKQENLISLEAGKIYKNTWTIEIF